MDINNFRIVFSNDSFSFHVAELKWKHSSGVYFFGFTVNSVISGTDLTCSYSADFGADARVEWKFQDLKGSLTYVIFDGKPTGK